MIRRAKNASVTRAFWPALLIFGALRFAQWGAAVTDDERYTLNYAFQPLSLIMTTYDAPNNHVLLNVIVHAVDAALPKKVLFSPASLRPVELPGVLASIATLPLLFWVASSLFGPAIALLSMIFLGLSYWHLMYSHMLRGYGFSTFLNLLNIWILDRAIGSNRLRLLWLLPLSMAGAHYFIPVNAYFSVALLPWIFFILYRESSTGKTSQFSWKQLLGGTRLTPVMTKTLAVETAFFAGVILSVALYSPILADLAREAHSQAMNWTQSLAATGTRLKDIVLVLGTNWIYRSACLALAAAGAAELISRPEKSAAAWLCLGYLAIPFLLLTLQGRVAFARIFITTLPIWAMLFAAGIHRIASRFRIPLWITASYVVLMFVPEAYAFVSWNRGLDLRPPRNAALRLVRHEDDFVVIFPKLGPAPAFHDVLSWEYYAYSGNLRPGEHAVQSKDYAFMARKEYLFIAHDSAEAADMMEQSGLDPYLRKTFREAGVFGKLRLYTVEQDPSVLADYAAAAENPGTPSSLRAQAYAGLGVSALKAGNLEGAARWLSRAKALAPQDVRTRFQLGFAKYLAFDDLGAAKEFAWVTASDKTNIYAPLYYADCLAALHKTQEAAKWYNWYLSPESPGNSWFLHTRAATAAAHLPSFRKDFSGATDPQIARAEDYIEQGAYERASHILAKPSTHKDETRRLVTWAAAESKQRNYYRAFQLLKEARNHIDNPEIEVQMADNLRKKYAVEEAGKIVEETLRRYPGYPNALTMQALIGKISEP